MALEDVIDDIVTIVGGVANTGGVFPRRRFNLEPALLDSVYSVVDATYPRGYKIQLCMVDREASPGGPTTQQEYLIEHQIVVTCMHEAYDALDTRTTFRIMVDAVCDAIRATTQTTEIEMLLWRGVRRDIEADLESVGLPVHLAEIVVQANERNVI